MTHTYLSTYCFHGQHGDCRLTCKICQTACICACHKVPVDECRVQDIPGHGPVRIHGGQPLSDKAKWAMREVIDAAKRRMEAVPSCPHCDHAPHYLACRIRVRDEGGHNRDRWPRFKPCGCREISMGAKP